MVGSLGFLLIDFFAALMLLSPLALAEVPHRPDQSGDERPNLAGPISDFLAQQEDEEKARRTVKELYKNIYVSGTLLPLRRGEEAGALFFGIVSGDVAEQPLMEQMVMEQFWSHGLGTTPEGERAILKRLLRGDRWARSILEKLNSSTLSWDSGKRCESSNRDRDDASPNYVLIDTGKREFSSMWPIPFGWWVKRYRCEALYLNPYHSKGAVHRLLQAKGASADIQEEAARVLVHLEGLGPEKK